MNKKLSIGLSCLLVVVALLVSSTSVFGGGWLMLVSTSLAWTPASKAGAGLGIDALSPAQFGSPAANGSISSWTDSVSGFAFGCFRLGFVLARIIIQ